MVPTLPRITTTLHVYHNNLALAHQPLVQMNHWKNSGSGSITAPMTTNIAYSPSILYSFQRESSIRRISKMGPSIYEIKPVYVLRKPSHHTGRYPIDGVIQQRFFSCTRVTPRQAQSVMKSISEMALASTKYHRHLEMQFNLSIRWDIGISG